MQQNILNILHFADLTMVFVYLLYLSRNNVDKSNSITLAIVIAMNYFMVPLAEVIKPIGDATLLRFTWYHSFALSDLMLIAALFYLHKKHRVVYGIAAKHVYISYFSLMCLQLLTYFDESLFQTDIARIVYPYAIPSVELSVNFVLTGVMLKTLFTPAPQTAQS